MKKKTKKAFKKKKRGLSPGLIAWMAKRKAASMSKKPKKTYKAKRKSTAARTTAAWPGKATLSKLRSRSRPTLKRAAVHQPANRSLW